MALMAAGVQPGLAGVQGLGRQPAGFARGNDALARGGDLPGRVIHIDDNLLLEFLQGDQ